MIDGNLNRMIAAKRLWMSVARVPRLAGRALVKLYRLTLSPLIGFHCRYLPTCSDYADQALERHGLWAGGWMTLARLMRCHPCGNSGLDFVPDATPRGRAGTCPGATAAGAAPIRAAAELQLSNFRFRSRMTVVNSRMSSSICLAIGPGVPLPGMKPMALKAFTDASVLKRRRQRLAEPRDHGRRRALRRHQAVPAGHDEILQAERGERLELRQLEPRPVAGVAEADHAAVVDQRLRGGEEHQVDAAGDQIGDGRRLAAIGHVGQLDAGRRLQHLGDQMMRRADADAADLEFAGLGLGARDRPRRASATPSSLLAQSV